MASPDLSDALVGGERSLSSCTLVFDRLGLAVHAITMADAPAVVHALGQLRAEAFGGASPWNYGLDSYDSHAVQIVCLDVATQKMVGALRLGLGDVVLARKGLEGLYLNDFWALQPDTHDFFQANVEFGRVWIEKGHPRLREVVTSLRMGAAAYAGQHGARQGFFGTVALRDYPKAAQRLIVSYLRKFHPWSVLRIRPLIEFDQMGWHEEQREDAGGYGPEALRQLIRMLRREDASHPFPFLLYIYLAQGAELLGDVALDSSGRKLLIPLYISLSAFQRGAAYLRASMEPGTTGTAVQQLISMT